MMVLNAQIEERHDDYECQTEDMTLNSERRTKKNW